MGLLNGCGGGGSGESATSVTTTTSTATTTTTTRVCDAPTPAPAPYPTQAPIWVEHGRGSGACRGPKIQRGEAVALSAGNGITLKSDFAPKGGCIYMTSRMPIDLNKQS